MTTHVAAWVPGDERDGPRLYWASDRRVGLDDGMHFARFFRPYPKSIGLERLWLAGAGQGWCIQRAIAAAPKCENVHDFVAVLAELAKTEPAWPATDDRPDWLVCDEQGLHMVLPSETFSARSMVPITVGSGRRYALGAALALLPQIPTARVDWANVVRRAVLVAGDCEQQTEGVECGVWRPGPTVYQLEAEDVAVPA